MIHNTARRRKGFSLIELMITVAVVAIIGAIAYPSYQNHLRKGRRASAQAFIMDLANREQQYLLDARNYAVGSAALTTLNVSPPSDVAAHYSVTIGPAAASTPPTFLITATPTSTAQSADGTLTLNEQGNKTRAGQAGW
ncbi:MAG TPA: type IV pilin protein [Burkholderiales bacterium]|nr:type IV pilin protein [Burkholderiales bacterium]